MKLSRDIFIAIFSTIIGIVIGGFLGYLISKHFYQVSKKEVKTELINGAFADISHDTFSGIFPELFDSTKLSGDDYLWRKLQTTGIDRLYFNIIVFVDYERFEEFSNIVTNAKLATEDFNEGITIRNLSVLKDPSWVRAGNFSTCRYYRQSVLPTLLKLQEYLKKNGTELILE